MGLLNPPTSTAKQPGPNTQTELAVKEFARIIKSPKHKAPCMPSLALTLYLKKTTSIMVTEEMMTILVVELREE